MQWNEVVSHLRARHRVGQATDRWIELWWRFRDGTLAIRQQQTLSLLQVHGDTYFVVASELGVPRRARSALRAHPRTGPGSLVEDADRLELRLTLPALGLTPPSLERVLYAIALEAVQLSALAQQPQPSTPAPAPAPALLSTPAPAR